MAAEAEGIILFSGRKRRVGFRDGLTAKKAKKSTEGFNKSLEISPHEEASPISVKKLAEKSHDASSIPPVSNENWDVGKEGANSERLDSNDNSVNEPGSSRNGAQEGVFLDEDVSFLDLGLSEWLTKTCRGLGMRQPTAVQCGCCPQILAGRNVIGVAQTGSGKTAAFALPILHMLSQDTYGVFALLLTPTRELANQIAEQFKALGVGMSAKVCVVVGGMDSHGQGLEIAKRPHIVVATPGRLASLCRNDEQLSGAFKRVKFLVLDEADKLLDVAFEEDLRKVLGHLPAKRQTLLFSATMTKGLVKLQQAALKDAYIYKAYDGLKASQTLEQKYVFIPKSAKETYLVHVLNSLEAMRVRSAIVFCSTCAGCKMLKCVLDELGFESAAIHSQLMQSSRFESLDRFKSGRVSMLVATDVASRGLDIPTVDLVINYELPIAPRDYVHRVGRTARAGKAGQSISFVSQYDIELLQKIEDLIGKKLTEFKTKEDVVLKGMNKVYIAKKAALLKVAREESLDTNKVRKRRK